MKAQASMQRAVHRVLSSPAADYDTWPEWSREKLDQNIPIDRKATAAHTLRSVTALHTFVNPNLSQPTPSSQTTVLHIQLYSSITLLKEVKTLFGLMLGAGKKTGC